MKISVFISVLLMLACGDTSLSQSDVPVKSNDSVVVSLDKDTLVETEDSLMTVPPPILSKKNPTASLAELKFRYKLKKPNDKFKLSNQLREISGIAILEQEKILYAINDEVGKIYQLSTKDGDIKDKNTFADPGDYEDITIGKNAIYVVKSNGILYEIDKSSLKATDKIRTGLRMSNDVEGMCYDGFTGMLLLACKGQPNLKSTDFPRTSKSVFAFDPVSKKIDTTPYLQIEDKKLEAFVQKTLGKKAKEKDLKKLLKRVPYFAPSAIAIHPTEDLIYVLSSVGKMLVVFNRQGDIQHIKFLSSSVHEQPEGMSFASNGDLYISNEGKSGRGLVYRFKYLKEE